ncbi:PREDICTED: GAS2-like protein 3 [Papilio polytes]|uniref:GAS2-like protein 3 n=1 Tax=Papilio polytes TaxID=76194 RepID=UPI0006761F49|nr:PREDICTED: GAS2-like protein 3 [Papilio polytes]XP_013144860.1 PREDICTED: GAS2-like protein 3 [Papilio polytes]XP_013144861.1 PREDICTED: GAS2-like protein 3 [Papilio polytes]XP_013144862.1 PREDICTED: GAS2-like protein 3 [Papilio polytes]
MAYYRCGPTAIGSRASWSVTSPTDQNTFERPLSGNFDRIFNAFERTNAFEYVRSTFEGGSEERGAGRAEALVRRVSSSYERADCALAAQAPSAADEDYYREKILYSQARQLFPLQEDLADWINKTIGTTYLTGDNFLEALDNGAELCQLAAVIQQRAREALDQGLVVGPVPQLRGRCWQRAARRSFFSRDNADNFLTFCRDLGVHENLLFESDDLVLHNQPRQVVLCLLEVARLATRYRLEPPGLVQLEREIAQEERDSGLDSAMSTAAWQFRDLTPPPHDPRDTQPDETHKHTAEPSATSQDQNDCQLGADNTDAESTRSDAASSDSDVPLRPTNELDKRVALVTRLLERGCSCSSARCSRLLKVKKVGEGRYNIAGRNVFIRLLKGRHMMVRVGGGWDTLEHFLSRHEPCQVRLVAPAHMAGAPPSPLPAPLPAAAASPTPDLPLDELDAKLSPIRISPATSKTSVASRDRSGTTTPVDSKASTSGKSSPTGGAAPSKKEGGVVSSTPNKARLKSALTLPIKAEPPRARKQSAPSFSTPNTPTNRSTRAPGELRKSLTSNTLLNAPKKSRSMSLGMQKDDKPSGAERPVKGKSRSTTVTPAPTPTLGSRKTRSQSLASTPVNEPRRTFAASNGHAKKTRSMSLATTADFGKPLVKSVSLSTGGAPMTQAAIEESIRLSLAATLVDDSCPKRPFLHIKAKYRSPPPREVPPR